MTVQNNANRTDDGVLWARPCRVTQFWVTGDGAADGRAIFYDNASAASGTILMELRTPATGKGSTVINIPGEGIRAAAGIYVDITTVGRVGIVFEG